MTVLAVAILLVGCQSKDKSGRAELALALGISCVPRSVHGIKYAEDAWTDYVLIIYCEVNSGEFDQLLAGRVYKRETEDPFSADKQLRTQVTPPEYAKSIPGFVAEERYSWEDGKKRSCEVLTTRAHDRIYAVYSAD